MLSEWKRRMKNIEKLQVIIYIKKTIKEIIK